MSAHLRALEHLNVRYDRTTELYSELADAVASLAQFVTDDGYSVMWDECTGNGDGAELIELAGRLRDESAISAAMMEKLRAREYIDGIERATHYFDNVESCIDSEFGSFAPGPESRILMVGIGSFPMTAVNIVRQTGATVVGTDIDPESVALGRRVVAEMGVDGIEVEVSGPHLKPRAATATHVIFSSTIPVKYRILHDLHPVLAADVTVVMRYGDGLKSLFNYPRVAVAEDRWRQIGMVARPGRLFDVALYRKAVTDDAA